MDCPKLVTGSQMADIDRRSIEEWGVPGAQLMERAGSEVVAALRDCYDGLEGLSVAVVCGKGNNGGDGFVVARLLHQSGVPVRVLLTADPDESSGDAAHHLRLLRQAGVKPRAMTTGDEVDLGECEVIVDAVLGTGVTGAARGPAAQAIEAMNRTARPLVAVDLPSGLEADTGKAHGPCVRATMTVTFGLPKVGQLLYPGRSYCGDLRVVDIGLPPEAVAASPVRTYLIDRQAVAGAVPRRHPEAHKGTCGSVAVIAGSVGMTGAAVLAAESALLSGAGRVTLGTPSSLNDILEVKLTEVMTRPLPEVRKARCLSLRAVGAVRRLLDGADSFAIGPGLGRHRETFGLVRCVLRATTLPGVVDADGLNALVGQADVLEDPGAAHLVLTPHVGEFARLSSLTVEAIAESPLERAREYAVRTGVTLVLKGAPTVVAAADGRAFVNPTGNAGMATAGAGDVLTGLVAGLLAQGLAPPTAARAAVYLHGRAGDLARDQLGEWGMKAGDVCRQVPEAVRDTVRSGPA